MQRSYTVCIFGLQYKYHFNYAIKRGEKKHENSNNTYMSPNSAENKTKTWKRKPLERTTVAVGYWTDYFFFKYNEKKSQRIDIRTHNHCQKPERIGKKGRAKTKRTKKKTFYFFSFKNYRFKKIMRKTGVLGEQKKSNTLHHRAWF